MFNYLQKLHVLNSLQQKFLQLVYFGLIGNIYILNRKIFQSTENKTGKTVANKTPDILLFRQNKTKKFIFKSVFLNSVLPVNCFLDCVIKYLCKVVNSLLSD